MLHRVQKRISIVPVPKVMCAIHFNLCNMQGPTHSARLYQAAWLLHLAALELHHADLAVQDTSCNAILAAYFTPENADDQETGQGLPALPMGD